MVLLSEPEFHFIQSIRNGRVSKEQNVGLQGRPGMKFKKVVDLYEASAPVGFTWKKNCCRRNLFPIETLKTDACSSLMDESVQSILDNEVPLIVWKSTLVKKLRSKKRLVKPCEDMIKENAFDAHVKSECSSVSSTLVESSMAGVGVSTIDCPSVSCSVGHERESSSSIAKHEVLDDGVDIFYSTEPTACSSADLIDRKTDDEDDISGYSVYTETPGDGNPESHGNSHLYVKPNLHDESGSCKTDGVQDSLMNIDPSDIDQAGNHSALRLRADIFFSKRKTISPISQEELCRALKISELDDDVKNSTSEERGRSKEITDRNGYSPRSILKVSKCPPAAIHPLCKGCTCAHSAISFSLRQMHDIESLALKLTEELNGMKGILDRAIHHDGFRLSDEAMVAIENASKAEETTNRWLSMMARDCNRFCKIMKKRKAEKAGLRSGGNKERKKIVFADEVGKMLCDVKVLEDDEVSEDET